MHTRMFYRHLVDPGVRKTRPLSIASPIWRVRAWHSSGLTVTLAA